MVDLGEKYDSDGRLEQKLRAALRPLPAPAGFADRVIARSRKLPLPRTLSFAVRQRGFQPVLHWSIAATLLLAVALGGVLEHQSRRRIAGERARDQVLLALRITSTTIHAVRNQVTADSHNN